MEKQVETRLKGSKQFDYCFIISIFDMYYSFFIGGGSFACGAWDLQFYTNSFKKTT